MEFALNDEQRSFQQNLAAFLREQLTPDIRRTYRRFGEYRGWDLDFTRSFRRKLGEAGYIGLAWPTQFGGQGRDQIYEVLFSEEMEYHQAPAYDSSLTYVPSAILAFGNDEQRSRFLPKMAAGETTFFLGYSEPEAGSDLANLSTSAVAEGDTFVITGQKSYSSNAHTADWGWVAVRTDPDSAKHRGISVFLVDMHSPGIEITRHQTLASWEHHSVYFDRVVVPRSNLVGQLNQGWKIIMGAIDFERASLGAPGLIRRQLEQLIDYCAQRNGDGARLIDDAAVADRLSSLAAQVEAARLISYWVASLQAAGQQPQFETSLATLVKREAVRALDVAGMDLLGQYASQTYESPWAPFDGDIEYGYRYHTFYQFAAGGFDITRNVIALRGLGMPR